MQPSQAHSRAPLRFERIRSVIERTGLSRSAIWRRAGKDFPTPIRIGPRTTAWNSAEIDQWIADLTAARGATVTRR